MNIMTVNELLKELAKVKDKDIPIVIHSGMTFHTIRTATEGPIKYDATWGIKHQEGVNILFLQRGDAL